MSAFRWVPKASLSSDVSSCGVKLGALVIVALGVSMLGCQSGESRDQRLEFARLARAVDVLRTAENSRKRPPFEKLRSEECAHYCDFQKLCIGAYEQHLAGLSAIEEARLLSATGDEAVVAPALALAQEKIEQARRLTTECAAHQGEIERQLRAR